MAAKSLSKIMEGSIQIPGVRVSLLGLEIDQALSQEQMGMVFACLEHISGCVSWLWGDALAFTGRKWGNQFVESKYEPAIRATGLAYPTLKAAKITCERICPARRRANLTFSHHLEVAFGFEDHAAQNEWLDRCEAEGWTVSQLRKAIRLAKQEIHEEPNRDAGKYQPVANTTKLIDWLRRQEVATWPDEQREAWISDLQPIVEFYNRLCSVGRAVDV